MARSLLNVRYNTLSSLNIMNISTNRKFRTQNVKLSQIYLQFYILPISQDISKETIDARWKIVVLINQVA